MNNEKKDGLGYQPFQNVVQALYDQEISPEQLCQSLRERGYETDAVIARVKAQVDQALQRDRLSWQEAARAKLQQLQAQRATIVSWATRKAAEIEEAFAAAVDGTLGPDAQARAVAFRNFKQASLQDKASILDDIETLKGGQGIPGQGGKTP
jgi:hypothetical protein